MSLPAAVRSLFKDLKKHKADIMPMNMRKAFAGKADRFQQFSVSLDDLLLDFSKCTITPKTFKLLLALAKASEIGKKRDAMFAGKKINITEQRAVLHTALRHQGEQPVKTGGKDVMPEVRQVLAHMRDYAAEVRRSGITDVVNIGIGGSDLGPAMTVQALTPYHDGPRLHFVSNVDGSQIFDTLKKLKPETTLFLIASKTFTTIETMTNAHTARKWLVQGLSEAAVSDHFAAISTNLEKVKEFGIAESHSFGFWDWVGGRYSIWSAIGLPLMIAVGPDNFDRFLQGGYAMDQHFREAPLAKNLPVIMGLLGIWHRNILDYPSRVILPYDQHLARFPAYLQQLDMESNGKHVTRSSTVSKLATGPVVWGEPGTNGQHAFYQLLHQGTDIIPAEFLVAAKSHEPDLKLHQDLLLANCLAQSQALMWGRTLKEASQQLKDMGKSATEIKKLAPHRVFTGNRPSLTLAYQQLDPYTLGRLIALYEHRVFVEAAIWDINAFDQWGVELGKELATALQAVIEGKKPAQDEDSSTAGLVKHLQFLR